MLSDLQPDRRGNQAKIFHKSFSFNLWCVGGDGVEDVDEDEEEGDLEKKKDKRDKKNGSWLPGEPSGLGSRPSG